MDYTAYARVVAEDLVRLKRRIANSKIPEKVADRNLIIGTWNVRAFGEVFKSWDENPDSPKRNLRAMVYIAEIIRRFDVIAIQEVKRDTSGLRMLLDDLLGSNWGVVISDVSAGSKGNAERLTYIYDKRRVLPSGLAGEIVLPPTSDGNPARQFDRSPYIVGFQTAKEKFALLTAHIRYGSGPDDRIEEITALSQYIAREIRKRANAGADEGNLIVLGDFNIEDRGDNPLFKAFVSTGLIVPAQLLNLRSTYDTKPKYYDQIAWFMDALNLPFSDKAGVIDFAGAVFKELTLSQMSFRLSDHFPLWAEFIIDRSQENMARVLGIDPAMPDPFASIPD
ncbi:MAG TPA: endonuclease/exonuclease/phosphatase family protein [Anaerolineales bacterium]